MTNLWKRLLPRLSRERQSDQTPIDGPPPKSVKVGSDRRQMLIYAAGPAAFGRRALTASEEVLATWHRTHKISSKFPNTPMSIEVTEKLASSQCAFGTSLSDASALIEEFQSPREDREESLNTAAQRDFLEEIELTNSILHHLNKAVEECFVRKPDRLEDWTSRYNMYRFCSSSEWFRGRRGTLQLEKFPVANAPLLNPEFVYLWFREEDSPEGTAKGSMVRGCIANAGSLTLSEVLATGTAGLMVGGQPTDRLIAWPADEHSPAMTALAELVSHMLSMETVHGALVLDNGRAMCWCELQDLPKPDDYKSTILKIVVSPYSPPEDERFNLSLGLFQWSLWAFKDSCRINKPNFFKELQHITKGRRRGWTYDPWEIDTMDNWLRQVFNCVEEDFPGRESEKLRLVFEELQWFFATDETAKEYQGDKVFSYRNLYKRIRIGGMPAALYPCQCECEMRLVTEMDIDSDKVERLDESDGTDSFDKVWKTIEWYIARDQSLWDKDRAKGSELRRVRSCL